VYIRIISLLVLSKPARGIGSYSAWHIQYSNEARIEYGPIWHLVSESKPMPFHLNFIHFREIARVILKLSVTRNKNLDRVSRKLEDKLQRKQQVAAEMATGGRAYRQQVYPTHS